jgi:glutamate N-acetyltransferase/amino-acid N-acetyltransferase
LSFFTSRWIEVPAGAVELAGGLPQGFRAAGVAAGIKESGLPDVGLVVCDAPEVSSAARFTRSGAQSAPVLVNRERVALNAIRAVVVNSGNANAATGEPGLHDAARMQQLAARAAGLSDPGRVAVASTGVIGVPMPMEMVSAGILAAGAALAPDGDGRFAEAIRTTDQYAKRVTLDITLSTGTVRLSAQAKGAGMISPNFATLLCFVQTDARLAPETCELLLGVCVKRSFERMSVDGQLSTSDTVILQCSGASGVEIHQETEDELRFGEAMDAVMRQLALLIARDGEGARRVKTAPYGGDPNWGRIIQAVGMALPGTAPLPVDIAIEGVTVCSAGAYVPHDAAALKAAVQRPEVEYEIGLPGQGAEVERYFSDLGHEYITINADYTT